MSHAEPAPEVKPCRRFALGVKLPQYPRVTLSAMAFALRAPSICRLCDHITTVATDTVFLSCSCPNCSPESSLTSGQVVAIERRTHKPDRRRVTRTDRRRGGPLKR
jgi:hypothetical protein